jgi:hypothetical protein
MADKNLTAEQKLLKLIEQSGSATQKKKSEFSIVDFLSVDDLKARCLRIQEYAIGFFKQGSQAHVTLNFAAVNKTLRIGSLFTLFGMVIMLLFEVGSVNVDLDKKFAIESQERTQIPLSQIYPFSSDIFSRVEKENVFVSSEQRFGGVNSEEAGPSLKLVEFTRDLKLTGISVNPDDELKTFCMIEDLQKNVTSFLRIGDTIAGMRVRSIGEDGVILHRGEEEVILR